MNPVSKFALPHCYEFGTNVFQGLADWGVEFVGVHMEPGWPYAAATPWLTAGPYRRHEAPQSCRNVSPVYYADFLAVPGHPEFDGRFFNCVTEIRDDAGYEWYPDGNVEESIGRGVRQSVRALDSKVLAALFTHEQYIQPITPGDWDSILAGVVAELEGYDPLYVPLDHAVTYVRALHTSAIGERSYNPQTERLVMTLTGRTDLQTAVTLFVDSEEGDGILEMTVEVPAFEGAAQLDLVLP